MNAAIVQCLPCPVGTDCAAQGSTLEALPLRKGYYRLDTTSVDVRSWTAPACAANIADLAAVT